MVILWMWGFVVLYMSGVWLWYRYQNNPSVVDVAWAVGLGICGILFLCEHPWTQRIRLLALILVIWGARLGGYLWFTRIRVKLVDARYTRLSATWRIPEPLGFFLNFQLQGVLMLIVALPWFFASNIVSPQISALDWFAFFLALFAIIGESLADYELYKFKKTTSGQVCNRGLWQYCRHPNYFFEWLTWCSFTLFALPQTWGWIAILSPVTLYGIMIYITAPMTERGSIQSRGEAYRRYQQLTPMFFPNVLMMVRRCRSHK
jgi:steroid 5-alpha reductase family enzyme